MTAPHSEVSAKHSARASVELLLQKEKQHSLPDRESPR